MKLQMHPNSLFAVLLRSPWWLSIAAAAGMFAVVRLVVPPLYAAFAALPFMVIGGYAAWRQLRAPSASRVAGALERLRAMTWEDFGAAVEDAFRREGYAVSRLGGAQADFELVRQGRTSLVACKRWKAGHTGIEPLRALHAAGRSREAAECIFVAAGEVTANARAFAAQNGIRVLEGAELAKLLGRYRSLAK
jgi:restriction system protein